MQALVQAHYVLVCTGTYLSQIGMDQRHQSIYGIRRPPRAHNLSQACKHAQVYISAKLGQIREIKVSMESVEHAGPL